MTRFLSGAALAAITLSAPLAAQVDLSVAPDKAVRYKITTSSKVANERETLMNGEAMRGRRGGGGGGITTTNVKLVFEEGRAGPDTWRAYHTAEAKVERPGRGGGEPSAQTITAGLQGKKLLIAEDDGGLVVREGDAKGKRLPDEMTRGLPVAMALGNLAPKKPVEVGQEFDMSAALPGAIKTLLHPVRPDSEANEGERGGGGERGGRGQRGGGGERGGRGQRGGGRGQRGFGRRTRAVVDTALETAANTKLKCKAVGKLLSVEEKDGVRLATVAITATISGKGTPAELGMSRGGLRGGRGGRGGGERGRAGGSEADGKAEATVHIKGTMTIDVAKHALRALKLEGKLNTMSSSKRTFERGGEGGEMETKSKSMGDFTVVVACEAATAAKK